MNARTLIVATLSGIALAATVQAQTTSQAERVRGAGTSATTTKMTGEVVWIDGPWLLTRLQPGGALTLFKVPPGREFMRA